MSDARWTDVDKDIDNALMHLGMAIRIFEAAGFDAPDLDGYKNSSAFMHAMAQATPRSKMRFGASSTSSVKHRPRVTRGTRISSTAYRDRCQATTPGPLSSMPKCAGIFSNV